jgi:hypothetical protein
MQLYVPLARCLFKAIEGMVDLAHKIRVLGVFEPWRLLHVDWLINIPVEKRGFEVHLTTRPGFSRHEGVQEEKRVEMLLFSFSS